MVQYDIGNLKRNYFFEVRGNIMIGLLGLITFGALAVFSLLYLSAIVSGKSPAIDKALVLIKRHMDYIGVASAAYGFLAACATPVLVSDPANMFVRLLGNIVLIIMALPYAFKRFEPQLAEKINVAIMDELKDIVTRVLALEKYIGFAGAITCIVTFVFVFRHS